MCLEYFVEVLKTVLIDLLDKTKKKKRLMATVHLASASQYRLIV